MSPLKQVYENIQSCCGCSACEHSCPSKAITMVRDEKGFAYPVINQTLCVGCGNCARICRAARDKFRVDLPEIYALRHPDKKVVRNSSSGGAFTLLSDLVLDEGGAVFGCVIDEDFRVVHAMARTTEARDRMRGSKYVQSDMLDIYARVRESCRERKTLFVGTPCQVAGLYAYLRDDPENLVTIDFLCHGTPSSVFLQEHIRFLEARYKKKVVDYKFRDKKYGWRHVETAIFEDGTTKSNFDTFRLKYFFSSNLNLRPSCYHCVYARQERVSDITIGDFLGAEKKLQDYSNTGVSLAILNSEKGRRWFKKLGQTGVLAQCTMDEIMQRALHSPSVKNKRSEMFWDVYLDKGYVEATRKFADSRKRHNIRFAIVSATVKLHLDPMINRIKTYIRKRIKHGQ